MERRNLALLCAGVLCFWLFALAVGTAQGAGLPLGERDRQCRRMPRRC